MFNFQLEVTELSDDVSRKKDTIDWNFCELRILKLQIQNIVV